MLHRNFYPGDVRRQLAELLSSYEARSDLPPTLVAAAVPHAGWRFSGGVAARTLKALAGRSSPRAILLFGAVHRERLDVSAVYPDGEWETPVGSVAVDAGLAEELLRELPDLLERNPGAHDSEHSLEVEAPLIHEMFPGVPVVPIMVPPEAEPAEVGKRAAMILRGRSVVAVASTDLTHYGPRFHLAPAGLGERAHSWMKDNDRRILELAVNLEAERIPREALVHRNACGSGALAAATAFARELGAKRASVLEHTDSHEVAGQGEPFETAVGYAGMVF
jgi:AmmeMemoRadiSam system protein B